MTTRTKTPQLHLLPILNLLGIAIPPLQRHLAVRIGVHQHVERAVAVERREEGHGCCDLAEYGLDVGLDLSFGFFDRFGGWCRGAWICV